MIITRTPLRISFFGGGTDYPAWFKENGGAVLSTSIDKYSHVSARFLPQFFDHRSKITYSKVELVKSREEIAHPVVRHALKFMDIRDGVEINNFDDLPSRAGMGSSSSFTVGLLHALSLLKGGRPTKEKLAYDAIHVEQNLLKENVGCQDQMAAAFGGFNKIVFEGSGGASPIHNNVKWSIKLEPIFLGEAKMKRFQDHLMLFFTGFSRNASEIAAHQIKNIPNKSKELSTMQGLVDEAIAVLKGDNINDFGKLLDETWKLKRSLSPHVTTSLIDEAYKAGKEAGALGGKLLGAGGGGFVLFFVPPGRRDAVRAKLKNLLIVPFKFDSDGTKVIYHEPEQNAQLA